MSEVYKLVPAPGAVRGSDLHFGPAESAAPVGMAIGNTSAPYIHHLIKLRPFWDAMKAGMSPAEMAIITSKTVVAVISYFLYTLI